MVRNAQMVYVEQITVTCDLCGRPEQTRDNYIKSCPGCGQDFHLRCGVHLSSIGYTCTECAKVVAPLVDAWRELEAEMRGMRNQANALEDVLGKVSWATAEALEEQRAMSAAKAKGGT